MTTENMDHRYEFHVRSISISISISICATVGIIQKVRRGVLFFPGKKAPLHFITSLQLHNIQKNTTLSFFLSRYRCSLKGWKLVALVKYS